jgi:hypothetical protein
VTTSDDVATAAAAVKIVRGSPDEEELAALVAGMVAVASAATADEDEPLARSAWMDRSRTLRGRRIVGPLGRGPLAWRNSLR